MNKPSSDFFVYYVYNVKTGAVVARRTELNINDPRMPSAGMNAAEWFEKFKKENSLEEGELRLLVDMTENIPNALIAKERREQRYKDKYKKEINK